MKTGGQILIADDHPVTREGLSLAVRSALAGVAVVGVGSIADAITEVGARPTFRMILLDFQLPDVQGYSGLLSLQFHAPTVPIVIVTAREDAMLVDAAKALGAAGYLFKSLPLDTIAGHIRVIDEGRHYFPAGVSASPLITAARARIDALSPAQHAVLMALTDGRSNKEIARERDLSEATVKAHLTAIFRKMGVANRTQALLAIQPLIGSAAT